MVKSKRRTKRKQKLGGPFLAAAFFCDNLVEDKSGAITAIKIIDRITISVAADMPEDVRVPVNLRGLVTFRSGGSPGKHTIRLDIESPTGKKETLAENVVHMSREPHGGSNLIVRGMIGTNKDGLFQIHVYLDNKYVTTMPLMVEIRRDPELRSGILLENQPVGKGAFPTKKS